MHYQTDNLWGQFSGLVLAGMNNPSRLFLPLLILAPAEILSARTKPNFTVIWKLNVAKSDLGSAPIQALVVVVEHNEPVFRYVAKGLAGGQPLGQRLPVDQVRQARFSGKQTTRRVV